MEQVIELTWKGFEDKSFYDMWLGDVPDAGALGTDWSFEANSKGKKF